MTGRDRVYPVVGRDREVGVFQRGVARAAEGQPGIVLVIGDAGIGKSTLLFEAARRAGTPLHLGRCAHVGGDAIPLAPLVDLIRQVQRERDVGQLPSLESLSELATSGAGRVGDVFTLALPALIEVVMTMSLDRGSRLSQRPLSKTACRYRRTGLRTFMGTR